MSDLVEMRQLLDPTRSGVAFFHNGNREEMREAIWGLAKGLPQDKGDEFPVEHIVNDGTYTRIMSIAKGSLLVGQIHLKSCVNLVLKGDISLLTEFGAKRVQAGFSGISQPGIMKVGYAHEDTIFANVFRTDRTDLVEIEHEIASVSRDALAELEYQP